MAFDSLSKATPAEKSDPLHEQMEALDDAYKAMRKEQDPKTGAALARDAQRAIAQASLLIPKLVAAMPDGPEKSLASAEYRLQTAQLLVVFCEAEKDFLAGKIDAIAGHVDRIKAMKKSGHDQFMEDEE